jgi:uncharacterized LabA/DUF88 family protein
MNKVIFYIDGFNFYYGLKEKNWKKYYWVDLNKLCERLLNHFPDRSLESIKYFTARISSPLDRVSRQRAYLKALKTLSNIEIIEGQYLDNLYTCYNCGHIRPNPKEKMTDVNIATNLIFDAVEDNFDIAYLVSADGDFAYLIDRLKSHFPRKRIISCFPPGKRSKALQKVSHAYFQIYERDLRHSLFPDTLQTEKGGILRCPNEWK